MFTIFSFTGIKGHIKKAHKDIDFPGGVYSTKELESTKKMKPVNEFFKSNLIDGEAWSKTHKSDSIDKSNQIDGEACSKTHKFNETEYYKSYLILAKSKAKGIDIDKLLEE